MARHRVGGSRAAVVNSSLTLWQRSVVAMPGHATLTFEAPAKPLLAFVAQMCFTIVLPTE